MKTHATIHELMKATFIANNLLTNILAKFIEWDNAFTTELPVYETKEKCEDRCDHL